MSRTFGINAPELETQFTVGDTTVFVVDVEIDDDGYATVLGHDDLGDEVEIKFYDRTNDS